jgi:protein pelota
MKKMKVLKKDLKHGKVVIQVQSLDDLWYLSQVIRKGDVVIGKTTRKVKLGAAEQSVKKNYVLSLLTSTLEFKDQSLRVSGKTTEPKEDIPKDSYHTIAAEPGDKLTIIKQKWHKYELDRINQATKEQLKALIGVFDRETCLLARLKSRGYEIITELKGKVKKKGYDSNVSTNFYKEIISAISDYDQRHKPDKIILASPAFWKEELMNELENSPKFDSLKQKIVKATCSSVSENAIDEVLKRPEMASALENAIAAKEMKLVDEIMTEIAKDGKIAYGIKETKTAVESGATERLIITDALIYKNPGNERLMKTTEDHGGKVFIINSENAAGQKLDSLGGIVAMLRFKLS